MGTLNPRGLLCVVKSDGKSNVQGLPFALRNRLLPAFIHSFIWKIIMMYAHQLLGAVGHIEVKVPVLGASVCDTGILTLMYINIAIMIMVLV